ncbi:protein tyrosine phosphatase type IVA 2-like [Hydractinia symbiolongicarpus]|uniref:protein tyrosine phosphatase type IVA 2-like n=1 Tax=Hydractinia symbiolongicarpus TaxID=13093 RepID=UPI002550F788|nr:protein tyrosine phosphatase type IVA 2-like [Hydractinia symbiolongicarpus]
MKMPPSNHLLPNFGHCLVEYKNMRFLIMDRPSKANIGQFVQELKKCEVCDVIRVCEPTYNSELLTKEGINVVDWQFDDGAAPPKVVVQSWLEFLKSRFQENPGATIAIHCVAGLGRAPVLVALALIESGMKYEDAVDYIRRRRRGAINSKQLEYLEKYKPMKLLKGKDKEKGCCIQ